ncbi:chorismate-binding protein [Naumannella halotolerans]|uniref:chorismate-binding protein n=1 Tax=Naumannella halotolerans TaxID=993414 RepID=UPI00370D7BB1
MNDQQFSARLDDLVSDRALVFGGPAEFVGAAQVSQVRPVLEQVEAATRAGRWAVGWVAYDATPAFLPEVSGFPEPDPALPPAGFWITGPPRVTSALSGLPEGRAVAEDWADRWSPAEHRLKVQQVRQAIARGETYQANLTTRLSGRLDGDPAAWYRDLGTAQRGAFHALFTHRDVTVVSASPERFFRWDDDGLLCSPMKGTAAHGPTPAADARAREALITSAKERAENVMITDLLRNDLSRIARLGTVRVSELLRAEPYPTVWQLVSDVRAEPAEGVGLPEIFAALFPCGSITGAPKISSTELLAELEGTARGLYCGTIGYVAPPGSSVRAEFGIAIRTAVVDRRSGRVDYGVGGGITFDSRPADELREIQAKARVVTEPSAPFALIETLGLRPVDGAAELINFEAHLRRLADSAAYFGFALDTALVRSRVARAVSGLSAARVRIELARDGAVEVSTAGLPPDPDRPLRLAVASAHPVDPDLVWVHHKTTRRDHCRRAAEAHPEADEVLLINTEGRITEATTANVIVLVDGEWLTPPSSDGCLPGVERGRLLAAGLIRERSLTPEDLASAERIELINSLRGRRVAVPADR